MPLGDFLRKTSSRQHDPSARARRRPSTKGRHPPLPLEGVPEEFLQFRDSVSEAPSSLPVISLSSHGYCQTKRRGLVKSYSDVLNNEQALKYFVLFMESESSGQIINFCVDVQNFKASAQSVSKCLSEQARQRKVSEGSNTREDWNGNEKYKSSDSETCRMQSNKDNDASEQSIHEDQVCPPASPSSDSFDSGIIIGQPEQPASVSGQDQNQVLSSEEQLILNQTKEALAIYQSYIAPESPLEVDLPNEIRQRIINGICSESGRVDPTSFDEALQILTTLILSKYFPHFLKSKFHISYTIDVLTRDGGRHVGIFDVLEDDNLIVLFGEFLSQLEGGGDHSSMLKFWISANEFRENSRREAENLYNDSSMTESMNLLQNTAVQIYQRFFSLQATTPLGFDDEMRFRIESSICNENGQVDVTSFDDASNLVVHVMHMKYLQKFINSQVFRQYIEKLKSELDNDANNRTVRPKLSKSESVQSFDSSEVEYSHRASSSEVEYSSRASFSSGAKRLNKIARSVSSTLDLDSNCLWKRKYNKITNIGFVDCLGRYTSTFDPPPGGFTNPASSEAVSSKLSRVVRRMMSSDIDKDKEEMAWQVANMIVGQVLALTGSSEFDSQDPSRVKDWKI